MKKGEQGSAGQAEAEIMCLRIPQTPGAPTPALAHPGFSDGITFRVTLRAEFIDWETQRNPGYLLYVNSNSQELLAVTTIDLLNLPPALKHQASTAFADRNVVTPFWQASGGTYTFVALSHPSLSGMSSQIGVRAVPLFDNGYSSPDFLVKEFTVSAGETKRYFIIPPENNNPSLFMESGGDHIVARLPGGSTGSLRFEPVATNPKTPDGDGNVQDVTHLSYWGTVVFDNSFTGFALEFIGDLADSSSHPKMKAGRFPTGVN